jgi:DNA-binding NarL/FixJ family response regulator
LLTEAVAYCLCASADLWVAARCTTDDPNLSLLSALNRVDQGEIVVDTIAPLARPTPAAAAVRWRATYLTGREQECLTLLVEGLGRAAVAHRLRVSPTTLRSHLQGLMTKLGVHSRLEAAALAMRYSLLENGSRALAGSGPKGEKPC